MERRSIQTLLSQGAAGGVCGSFLATCAVVLSYPDPYNLLILIFLPISFLFGAVIGTGIGFVIWMSESLLSRKRGVLSRIVISIVITILLSVLPSFSQEHDGGMEISLLFRFVLIIVFGVPIGMLTGSRVLPGRLIARGTGPLPRVKILFRKEPIRVSRTIEELRFSFLMGLPLRAASLLGLMGSLFVIVYFLSLLLESWRGFNNPEITKSLIDNGFIDWVIVTAYLASAVIVSFTLRNKLLVLIFSVLINVALMVWMFSLNESRFNAVRVFWAFFASLWFLFMIGKVTLPIKRGPVHVNYRWTD